jgi:hypothetical protein
MANLKVGDVAVIVDASDTVFEVGETVRVIEVDLLDVIHPYCVQRIRDGHFRASARDWVGTEQVRKAETPRAIRSSKQTKGDR